MVKRNMKINGSSITTEVIIPDIHAEIDLEGVELLKLESWQPGTGVMCTTGTLWLTQQGDPNDHFLKAGQSFILNPRGIVLVQGMPCGKALVLPQGFTSQTGLEQRESHPFIARPQSEPCGG